MGGLRTPRVVKIFFSSPFGGMEEEREELTRRYFPSINHLCNSLGLQFVAVDMRWGITSESSDKSQVINICLREIDRSDMFVGFFGQRYGWHGADDGSLQKNFDNALPNYPWLEQVRDKSVTELEFLHGFLNNPGQLPATLYFRDKSYDDMIREEGIKKGDKKQVFKYSAESEHSTKLMDDLKHRVWDLKDKSLGVYMDYKTPAEAAKTMYETIMSYLKGTLLANFNEKKLSERAELSSQHDAFLASRADIYVGGEKYMQQLDNLLMSETGRHVVVTGEEGCGKSALLCNWINSVKHKHDNCVVFYHFIGFAEGSADVSRMLIRMVEEVAYVLSKFVDGEPKEMKWEGLPEDDNEKTRHLMNELLTLLNKLITYGKTPVLVFDGLEKLLKVSNIKKALFWLPTNIPSSCFVVVATKLNDVDNITELKLRNYSTIEVETLNNEAKRDLCVKVLQKSGKELSTEQLDCIVNAEMTSNPLFLRITLSELVSFGYFRLLDKKISSLITSDSIEALFHQVLLRLEEDYNVTDYEGNLIEQVLSCIHLSSQGLSEGEIKELFTIPDHVWSPFYFAVDNLMINQSGRLQFGFSELSDAVEQKYLQDPDKKQYYIQCLVQYHEEKLKELDLTDYIRGIQFAMCRPAFELPTLYLKLQDYDKLASCLSNFFVFTHLHAHTKYQLILLWNHTGLTGAQIRDKLLASFDKRVAEIYLHMEENNLLQTGEPPGYQLIEFLEDVDNYLSTSGYRDERIKVMQRAMTIAENAIRNECVQDKQKCDTHLFNYKYIIACVYAESYHTTEQGIQLHKDIIQHYQQKIESEGSSAVYLEKLSNSYHGIGVAYMTMQEYEKVGEYILKSIEYTEQSGASDALTHLATSWNNLGMSLLHQQKYEDALKYIDKTLEAYEKIYFGEDPPILGEILTNKGLCLRRVGNLDEAEQIYKRSLEVKMKGVGREHGIVAKSYLNLGSLEAIRGNYEAALKQFNECKDIYEALDQTWDNPDFIMTIENIMMCYLNMQDYEKADKYCMKIMNWRIEDGSVDRCAYTIFVDMAKYYIQQNALMKAYRLLYALLDSVHSEKEGGTIYCLLDYVLIRLPSKYMEELPEKFSIKYCAESHPENTEFIKEYMIGHLVPSANLDEISRILSVHGEYLDMEPDIYNSIAEHWCTMPDDEINLHCRQRILQDGLVKYPDDLGLNLSLAKCYRLLEDPANALVHLLKLVDEQLDNVGLLFMTVDTAILAGDVPMATKWCSYIEQNFEDESVRNTVSNLKETIEKMKQEK